MTERGISVVVCPRERTCTGCGSRARNGPRKVRLAIGGISHVLCGECQRIVVDLLAAKAVGDLLTAEAGIVEGGEGLERAWT